MTRHGRAASTDSTVFPNGDAPLRTMRERHHDRGRVHFGGCLDDAAPRLSRSDALDVTGYSAAALDSGLVDHRFCLHELLLKARVNRQGVRDRHQGQYVDAALSAGGELGGRRQDVLVVMPIDRRDQHGVVLDFSVDDRMRDDHLVGRG